MHELTILYPSLIFILACTVNIQAVQYSDLEDLGVACKDRDNCAHMPDNTDFFGRNCECDQYCSSFGDCCIDAFSSRRQRNMKLTCMEFGGGLILGAYVIDKCPTNYRGSNNIRNKCQLQNDLSDPLAATPVTSVPVGITYRNRYCAQCNNAPSSSLRSWMVLLACETLALYNVNSSFTWKNVEYRANLKEWGVQFQGQFHYCDILFDKPDYLSSKVRLCKANTISACPSNYNNMTMKVACESYTAVVRARKGGTETFYRNPHCALCNSVERSSINCLLDGLHFRRKKPFSFPMLVDVNRSNGDIVGEVQRCPSEEVYDPFFKKCRPLKCVIPGRRMVNGKCVKV